MIDEIAFKDWFQRIVDGSGKRIKQSNVFLSIFTKGYEREPQCALELGIAIMLDKPIYIAAPHGTKIPENIKRLARAVEFFDPNNQADIERATKVLVEKGMAKHAD